MACGRDSHPSSDLVLSCGPHERPAAAGLEARPGYEAPARGGCRVKKTASLIREDEGFRRFIGTYCLPNQQISEHQQRDMYPLQALLGLAPLRIFAVWAVSSSIRENPRDRRTSSGKQRARSGTALRISDEQLLLRRKPSYEFSSGFQ